MVVVFMVAVGVVFVFFCSGLHFPMWNAKGNLTAHLMRDLRLSLPGHATVTHAVRVAYRDPGEYYAVELPQVEAAAFVAKVRLASHELEEVDPARPWSMGRIPTWWKPNDLPNLKRLDFQLQSGLGGYMLYYSESAGTVYLFWYEI